MFPPLWTVRDVRPLAAPDCDGYVWQAHVTAADGSHGVVTFHEHGWAKTDPDAPSAKEVLAALEPHTPDNEAGATYVEQLQDGHIVLVR